MGRAHTLQREGVLSQIVDETKHVLRANTLGHDSGDGPVSKIGWKEASTFPGFCAAHDAALFGPIERGRFTGSPQQTFLVGYRALCHEVFAKSSAALGLAKVQDVIDRGRSEEEQRRIQERLGDQQTGVVRGRDENKWYKEQADEIVKSGDYDRWGGAVFKVAGPLSVASAGSATPSFDFSRQRIQNLADFTRRVQPVMFGIVPDAKNSNFVVFSWPPACQAIDHLIASFEGLPTDEVGDALARFMFAHVENTYFAHGWWNALSALQRAEVIRLSALMLPKDEKTILGRSRLVEWQLVDKHVRFAGA